VGLSLPVKIFRGEPEVFWKRRNSASRLKHSNPARVPCSPACIFQTQCCSIYSSLNLWPAGACPTDSTHNSQLQEPLRFLKPLPVYLSVCLSHHSESTQIGPRTLLGRCSRPLYKMAECLRITRAHPPVYFKPLLHYLEYLNQCKCYENSCYAVQEKSLDMFRTDTVPFWILSSHIWLNPWMRKSHRYRALAIDISNHNSLENPD
jgi:hypothetical protein